MLEITTIFLLLHLVCEVMTTYVRYNYAAHKKQMKGANIANYFAVSSRAFITLYALGISYQIEKNSLNSSKYLLISAVAFFLSAVFSWYLVGKTIQTIETNFIHSILTSKKSTKSVNLINIKISSVLSIFIGIQFVSMIFAFAACLSYPNYRLSIISMTPVLNMLGTLATVVLVEPKLAFAVDNDSNLGFDAARIFSQARVLSFSFSAFLLFGCYFIAQ